MLILSVLNLIKSILISLRKGLDNHLTIMNINRLLGNHQPFKRGQPVYCTWAKDLKRIYKVFHRNELTKLPDNSLFDFKKVDIVLTMMALSIFM